MSEENTDLAFELLCECKSAWGIHSDPLNFAYENSVYDIVAHTCSKKYLKKQMKVDTRVMKKKKQKIYTSTAYVLTNNKNNIRHVVRQGPSK